MTIDENPPSASGDEEGFRFDVGAEVKESPSVVSCRSQMLGKVRNASWRVDSELGLGFRIASISYFACHTSSWYIPYRAK